MDCLFCKIIESSIPSKTIYEDDIVKVFLDINPSSNGHMLIIPKKHILDLDNIEESLIYLKNQAKEVGHPIDGIVITYDDIKYGDSLGRTEHHFNNGVAYKFEDEIMETTLIDIEWSMGRTGDLTPVAIFNPVIIDGTEVNRASCHNLTYLKNMCLGIGDKIGVYKANMIIPQIKTNYTNSGNLNIPIICPYCHEFLTINKDNETEVVHCSNNNCQGKILGKITHYVSKSAMNIDGISESTISTLISMDILHTYKDLYHLEEYKEELFNLRFQQATGNLEKPSRIRDLRHQVARLKTVLRERELAEANK